MLEKENQNVGLVFFKSNTKVFRVKNILELVGHADLHEAANNSKAIIPTDGFTAYGDVMLMSGAENGWYFKIDPE